jgi:glutamate 5-kinase
MSRIAIKIGSSVLSTDQNGPDDQALSQIIADIVDIRRIGHEVCIVTSGAIVWGRHKPELDKKFPVVEASNLRRSGQKRLLREQILASVGQPLLIARYAALFSSHNVNIAQLLLTRQDLADQGRFESLRSVTVNLFQLGIVPIFNENDVLSAEEIDFSDNDQLACMLATALQVSKLVILTNVEGLYDKPPTDPSAKIIREVKNIDELNVTVTEGKSTIGRGGMKSKLEAARLVTSFGVEMSIVNGKRAGVLRHLLLEGKPTGTLFLPRGPKLKQRRSWLALAAQSRGEIIVSTFLAEALLARRPASILLIGVEKVVGSFRKNDVVTVKDMGGKTLGRGEVRMSSEELGAKIEKRRQQEEVELFGSEVIHCDYFVTSPDGTIRDFV